MKVTGELVELGEELKGARRLKELSLAAVAKPALISAAYLQHLEKGVVRNPSPRVLHRVAGVLELSYARLMELAGYFMPNMEEGREGQPSAGDELTAGLTQEERRAVAAFIAYLKAR